MNEEELPKYRGSLIKICVFLFPIIIYYFMRYKYEDKKYKYCSLACILSMYLTILTSYFLHSYNKSRTDKEFHNRMQRLDHLCITITFFCFYLPFTLLISDKTSTYFYSFNIILITIYLLYILSCESENTNGTTSNIIKGIQFVFNMIFFIFIISRKINTSQKIIWSLIYITILTGFYSYIKRPEWSTIKKGEFEYHELLHTSFIIICLLTVLSVISLNKKEYKELINITNDITN